MSTKQDFTKSDYERTKRFLGAITETVKDQETKELKDAALLNVFVAALKGTEYKMSEVFNEDFLAKHQTNLLYMWGESDKWNDGE